MLNKQIISQIKSAEHLTSMPMRVKTDIDRFEQVLKNILHYAIQQSAKNAKIQIESWLTKSETAERLFL